MTDNELLLEISDIMQMQFQPVCEKLDRIDDRIGSLESRLGFVEKRLDSLESRLDSLESRMDFVESQLNDFKAQMNGFNIRLEKVEFSIETEVLPLQRELSSYGLSTYQRYQDSVEKIELLEKNQQVLMRVVAEHSKELKRLS